ncbi:hypothetical protein [Rhodoferax saidenbachensis]|uniref:Solute-binding protein family 3/N-terminal domain-containing protein n=1 Tax=Rhodoferax saidenbachensis TaxID=1484693 RepID=A0A1P8KEP0_9BURK|nr:hypothetical protein [Rhodoferax saidenbachensis]APW44500.1 hypothetical protein RS694_19575 [Rhodoferax saidenbachensis]
MFVIPPHLLPRLALCAALLGAGCGAGAACSRPIVVPVSSIGVVMVVDGERVSGVYPEVLRDLSEKSGCVFQFQVYPRARSDQMFFDAGTMDVTLPASFVAERAQIATFVPLVKILPTLVSLKPLAADVVSVKQLLENKALRGAVVRGFTFGKEYQALVDTLDKEGRLDMANDISTVARMLVAARVDFTVVPPHLLRAALANDAKGAVWLGQVKSQPLEGLPRIDSGVYISRRSLSEADQEALRVLFTAAARDELFVKGHLKYYPAEAIRGIVTRP